MTPAEYHAIWDAAIEAVSQGSDREAVIAEAALLLGLPEQHTERLFREEAKIRDQVARRKSKGRPKINFFWILPVGGSVLDLTGYKAHDLFDGDAVERAFDAESVEVAEEILTAAYFGPDTAGVGIEWDVTI